MQMIDFPNEELYFGPSKLWSKYISCRQLTNTKDT